MCVSRIKVKRSSSILLICQYMHSSVGASRFRNCQWTKVTAMAQVYTAHPKASITLLSQSIHVFRPDILSLWRHPENLSFQISYARSSPCCLPLWTFNFGHDVGSNVRKRKCLSRGLTASVCSQDNFSISVACIYFSSRTIWCDKWHIWRDRVHFFVCISRKLKTKF